MTTLRAWHACHGAPRGHACHDGDMSDLEPEDARSTGGARVQAALVAVLVIATALLLGGGLMLLVLARAMTGDAATVQSDRAAQAADLVGAGGPEALASGQGAHLRAGGLLQVVDDRGRLVWSSDPRSVAPAAGLQLAPGESATRTVLSIFGDEDDHTTTGFGVDHGGARYTVLASGSLRHVQHALRVDAASLAVLVPAIALLGGFAAWVLVGRTLRPVEEIRATVETITASSLSQRVPQPPGNDEIARLARTMNAMLDRVDASQMAQQRFVADASHELRSPIAALAAGLEVVSSEPGALPEIAPLLDAETRRLAELSEGLLLLARGDAGQLRRHDEEVDLDDLAEAEVRRLRQDPGVVVEAHLVPARLVGDRDALARVLRNLVDNARSACAGRVGLTMRRQPDEVLLLVDDDGPGIPATERSRVFDRFVRLDEARSRRPGGTGLGLAIVRAAVQAHGGSIRVTESDWGGARFEVRLPLS